MSLGTHELGAFEIGTAPSPLAPGVSPPPPAPAPAPEPAPDLNYVFRPMSAQLVTPLPTPPSRRNPVNFNIRADAFNDALQKFCEEINQATPGDSAAGLAQYLAQTGDGKGALLVGFLSALSGATTRTVHSKLSDTVSALDFMTDAERVDYVSGTLSLDLTAKIQAAINSLARGTVVLPAGAALCGALTLKSDVSVVGVGPASRLVPKPGTADFLVGSVSRVRLSDFYIDCSNQTAGGGCGLKLNQFTDSEISGVTVYNAGSFGWLIFNSVRSRFLRNTIDTTRQWDGMTISTGSTDNIIQGNTVINSYDSGIGFTDTLRTVCTSNVVNRQQIGGVYFAPGIDASGAKDATITGNYVSGNEVGIQLVVHPNTGKVPKRVTCSGNTVGNGLYGVKVGGSVLEPGVTQEGTSLEQMNISGNVIFSATVEGVRVDSSTDCAVVSNVIANCGTGVIAPNNTRLSLLTNRITACSTGVNLSSGNTDFSVMNNVVEQNTTNWTGSIPGGSATYMAHNKNGGLNYSMSGHDPYTDNWGLPGRLKLGNYNLWVDAAGKLRIKSGNPTGDTDGVIVGAQT
jgi:hypothetical protein